MAETQLAILFTSIALVVIGLYAAIFVDNIIKKIGKYNLPIFLFD